LILKKESSSAYAVSLERSVLYRVLIFLMNVMTR